MMCNYYDYCTNNIECDECMALGYYYLVEQDFKQSAKENIVKDIKVLLKEISNIIEGLK